MARSLISKCLVCCGAFTAVALVLFAFANHEALLARLSFWWGEHLGYPTAAVTVENFGPSRPPIDDRIVIPRLHVSAPLQFPQDDEPAALLAALEHGVVHYPGSVLPGEVGLTFLVGHSSNYAWAPGEYKAVFALLDELRPGDAVQLDYHGQRFAYRVTGSRVVAPDDFSVLEADTDTPLLRLMTCTPTGTTAQRLIVEAAFVPRTDPAS